jgi:hypothetical protein
MISLVVVLGGASVAVAAPETLPWRTFSQATDYVVNADAVACPGSPTEPVTRAMFRYGTERYAYMAKDARWVLWRLQAEDRGTGESMPDHIWFGDQDVGGSADVMHVIMDMDYERANEQFAGPCAWLERGPIL